LTQRTGSARQRRVPLRLGNRIDTFSTEICDRTRTYQSGCSALPILDSATIPMGSQRIRSPTEVTQTEGSWEALPHSRQETHESAASECINEPNVASPFYGISYVAEGERLHEGRKEYSAWDVYNNEAKKVDDELVKDWTVSLNFLLVFVRPSFIFMPYRSQGTHKAIGSHFCCRPDGVYHGEYWATSARPYASALRSHGILHQQPG